MVLKSPSSIVPRPLHLLTAKRPLSYSDVLISFTPGRRTAFAVVFKCCVFSSTRECLSWTLKTAGVAESGFRQGRYESGFNFLLFFRNTIMKGKHKSGQKSLCPPVETRWAVESPWRSLNQIKFWLSSRPNVTHPSFERSGPTLPHYASVQPKSGQSGNGKVLLRLTGFNANPRRWRREIVVVWNASRGANRWMFTTSHTDVWSH